MTRDEFVCSGCLLPFEDDDLGVVYDTVMIELFFSISEVTLPGIFRVRTWSEHVVL